VRAEFANLPVGVKAAADRAHGDVLVAMQEVLPVRGHLPAVPDRRQRHGLLHAAERRRGGLQERRRRNAPEGVTPRTAKDRVGAMPTRSVCSGRRKPLSRAVRRCPGATFASSRGKSVQKTPGDDVNVRLDTYVCGGSWISHREGHSASVTQETGPTSLSTRFRCAAAGSAMAGP
jgi:hypothetical protein